MTVATVPFVDCSVDPSADDWASPKADPTVPMIAATVVSLASKAVTGREELRLLHCWFRIRLVVG